MIMFHSQITCPSLPSDKVILNNALDLDKGSSDIHSALKYFNSITEYMMQLRNVLRELRDDIE